MSRRFMRNIMARHQHSFHQLRVSGCLLRFPCRLKSKWRHTLTLFDVSILVSTTSPEPVVAASSAVKSESMALGLGIGVGLAFVLLVVYVIKFRLGGKAKAQISFAPTEMSSAATFDGSMFSTSASWYHGQLDPIQAEQRLRTAGFSNGSFLVWLKSRDPYRAVHVLSLVDAHKVRHVSLVEDKLIEKLLIDGSGEVTWATTLEACITHLQKHSEQAFPYALGKVVSRPRLLIPPTAPMPSPSSANGHAILAAGDSATCSRPRADTLGTWLTSQHHHEETSVDNPRLPSRDAEHAVPVANSNHKGTITSSSNSQDVHIVSGQTTLSTSIKISGAPRSTSLSRPETSQAATSIPRSLSMSDATPQARSSKTVTLRQVLMLSEFAEGDDSSQS
jgi:hypothetical protein